MAKKPTQPPVQFEVGDSVCWQDASEMEWIYGSIKGFQTSKGLRCAIIKVDKDSPALEGSTQVWPEALLHFDNKPVAAPAKKAKTSAAVKKVKPAPPKKVQKVFTTSTGLSPAQKAWETIRARKAAACGAAA